MQAIYVVAYNLLCMLYVLSHKKTQLNIIQANDIRF